MSDGSAGITRRRALLATGTIGTAVAGVGAGTSAFLTDREPFDDNNVVAGQLDLKVAWRKTVNQARTTVDESRGFPTPRSDADAPICELSDVKPGDSGRIEFVLEIVDSPGYVSLLGREQTDEENEHPESGVPTGALPDGREGELDELVNVTVSYGVVESHGVSAEREAYTASIASIVDTAKMGSGIPLDGDGSAPVIDTVTGEAVPAPFAAGTRHGVRVDFTVPRSIGGSIQADGYRFAVGFNTQQARGDER